MVASRLRSLAALCVCICAALHFAAGESSRRKAKQYGTFVGSFPNVSHGIQGDVYVVDDSTLFVKNFSYDGRSSDAFFWVGNATQPTPGGVPVPYPDHPNRKPQQLGAYSNSDVILRLPANVRVRDIRSLSIWNTRFTINFDSVVFPEDVRIPSVRVLPEFSRLAHGLRSDNITILDSKTFYIPNLHYDGGGPDAYFFVGTGSEPNMHGTKVPNEMNSSTPLLGYEGVDIEIVLPGNLTVYEIDWLAVWCVQYRHNFGHVLIPKDLEVPPALGQTKIAVPTVTPLL